MKTNLLGFLFGESQVREELDAQIEDDLTKLFEQADEEDLTARKSPLADALKAIGVSDSVQEDPMGFCIHFDCADSHREAVAKIFQPDTIHKLAELGWVAANCGDQAMSNEPGDFKIRFIEIHEVEVGDSDKAPSLEKTMRGGQKDDTTKQDRKDDDLNPVERKDYTSGDEQKGVGDAKDGADPEGKPKGSSKSESIVLGLLDEGGHKPGCQCGFCKNKGSFGKKKDKGAVEKDDGHETPEGGHPNDTTGIGAQEPGGMPESIVSNLLDSEGLDETKKKKAAGKGKMVAKSPGKVTNEDCGIPSCGRTSKKKVKTVAKAPGKVTHESDELPEPPRVDEMTTCGAIPPMEAPMALNGGSRAKPDAKERLRRLKMRRDPDGVE